MHLAKTEIPVGTSSEKDSNGNPNQSSAAEFSGQVITNDALATDVERHPDEVTTYRADPMFTESKQAHEAGAVHAVAAASETSRTAMATMDAKSDITGVVEQAQSSTVCRVPLSRIKRSRFQGRIEQDPELDSMAESLKTSGLIHFVVLQNSGNGFFEIIVGHRRVAAAQLIGWTHIAAIVVDLSPRECLKLHLRENGDRLDLNCMERALEYEKSLGEAGGISALAEIVGRDKSYVSETLSLRTLLPEIQQYLLTSCVAKQIERSAARRGQGSAAEQQRNANPYLTYSFAVPLAQLSERSFFREQHAIFTKWKCHNLCRNEVRALVWVVQSGLIHPTSELYELMLSHPGMTAALALLLAVPQQSEKFVKDENLRAQVEAVPAMVRFQAARSLAVQGLPLTQVIKFLVSRSAAERHPEPSDAKKILDVLDLADQALEIRLRGGIESLRNFPEFSDVLETMRAVRSKVDLLLADAGSSKELILKAKEVVGEKRGEA